MTKTLTPAALSAQHARRNLEAALEDLSDIVDEMSAVTVRDMSEAEWDDLQQRFHATDLRVVTAEKDLEGVAEERSETRTQRRRNQTQNRKQTQVSETITPDDAVYTLGTRGPSFFGDLVAARQGDNNAADRLARHNAASEERDLSTVDAAGGAFVPPWHIIDEWAEAARTTRPVADICQQRTLPDYGDTVILPRVSTGGSVAAHVEAASVSKTDPVTAEVSSPVATISGQIDVSRKAFERSAPGLDEVLSRDLLAAFDQELDRLVIYGTGSGAEWGGINANLGATVTYTDASPTFGELLPKLAEAVSTASLARRKPPTHWIMSPRRWADVLRAVDTAGRPLVTPDGPFANAGVPGAVVAEGFAGTLLGLPVIIDANVKTIAGTGTNQDEIFLVRDEDLHLYTRPPVVKVFEDVLSGTGAIRIQVYSYAALVVARTEGIVKVSGTGLTNPW